MSHPLDAASLLIGVGLGFVCALVMIFVIYRGSEK